MAEFWGAALGYDAAPAGESWAARDPAGDGPALFFNRMAKSPTIEIPIHLDLNAADREAEVARLRSLGARLVVTKTISVGDFSETHTVLRDPAGNGFCVQGPDPRAGARPYVFNVTFAAADPPRIARFWSEALGWPEQRATDDFIRTLLDGGLDPAEIDAYVAVRHPDLRPPRLLFQRRQKSPTESIPIHLDLAAGDRPEEVARLQVAGATVVETKTRPEDDRVWTVLRDPEGNPFCVE